MGAQDARDDRRGKRGAEENRGTTGEFFWDGLPSMLFWVDPVQDMAVVFATVTALFWLAPASNEVAARATVALRAVAAERPTAVPSPV